MTKYTVDREQAGQVLLHFLERRPGRCVLCGYDLLPHFGCEGNPLLSGYSIISFSGIGVLEEL